MLPGMFRALGIALLMISAGCAGCGKSASNQDKTTSTTPDEEKVIPVPGAKGGPGQTEGASTGAVTGGDPNAQAANAPPNPAFFLKPEEGTLTVDKAEGKA